MAVDRFAVGLSIVAVAAAGYAAWAVQGLTHDLRSQQEQNGVLSLRLADAEAALAAAKAPAAKAPPLAEPSAPMGAAGLAGRAPAGAAGAPAKDVESRLAALEKSEAEIRRIAGGGVALPATGDGGAAALPQVADAPMHFDMPKIYGSPEDAAKDLDLSPSQKAEFERAAADAKREMGDLKKIPDETGKTWDDVSKDTFKVGENGGFSFDTTKLREFREKTVPGRNESYGAAERRIRDGAKSRLRSALTPDQQSKFDKAMVDPMLGTGGNGDVGMVFSTIEVTAPTPAAK